MTADNLRQLFGGQLTNIERQELDDGKIYRNQSLKNYNINGVNFDVSFEMGTVDDKLKRVRLICNPALPSHFSQFEQLLIDKYGQSQSKDESQGIGRSYDKTASWLLPSTKIELKYSYARGFISILNILYSDKVSLKESSDKL